MNGRLWARCDTQTTRPTRIDIRGVGHLHSVHSKLESGQQSEFAILCVIDTPHFKYVFGAYPHAIAFTLTPIEVNYGLDDSRLLFAVGGL
jgi:hypothetical protein